MIEREIGKARRRIEDDRLIRGQGRYPDDLAPADALHAAFVRCPYPSARIRALDARAALAAPGVVAVLTGADLPPIGGVRVPRSTSQVPGARDPAPGTRHEAPGTRDPEPSTHRAATGGGPRESTTTAPGGPDFLAAPQPILARDVASHVGVPVALVVADTGAQAVDAAALVEVDWEPLASVSDVDAAAAASAPLVHERLGTNVAFVARRGTPPEQIEALFAQAAHRVRRRLLVPRLAGVPIQPMAVVVAPDRATGDVTIWSTTQAPWRVRSAVAASLGIAEARVRSIAPDVGGGFGVRGPVYAEYLAVAHAAHRLGRAVRWTATRSEDMVATRGARDVAIDGEIAADAAGHILAIRARVRLNLGAYADVPGPGRRILDCMNGAYLAEGVSVELTGVYTNTTPTGAYRGAGRPEAAYAVERLVDALAQEGGFDPVELRCRNFIPPERFPYTTPLGSVYDSADYAPPFRQALALVDYPALRRRQAELRRSGSARLLGIGFATYVEPTASGWESGLVRIEPSGRVVAFSGSSAHGQGHLTTFGQVVADRLGVPFEWVTVRQGDTAAGPPGIGTFGSRSVALGGSALLQASERVLAKARQIAAHLLEASVADVVPVPGGLAVAGAPGREVGWPRIAAAAYGAGLPPGMEPGLEATSYFSMERDPFSFGATIAVVTVDAETGVVSLDRLVSVDDCGTVVNPLLLEGQSHGGFAQGIGAALMEQVLFDPEGQLLTGTLMDYAVPRASDLPNVDLGHAVTPSPWNLLGAKGHGESGTIAAPPCIVGAVVDALAPLGVTAIDPPLTPERVWAAIRAQAR